MRIKQRYLLAFITRLLTASSAFLAVVLPVAVPDVFTQPLAPLSCAWPANGGVAENCLEDNPLSYKATHESAVVDSADLPTRTGSWRDLRFSLPAAGERPENTSAGPIYMARTRAAGDSSNLETPTVGITETVAASDETLAPGTGPGGPIMVVANPGNPFTRYYSEILLAEGFNAFTVTNLSKVTASLLDSYDVVILGEMTLAASQVITFSDWVNAGGNLIAMRPDKQLSALLGLTDASDTLANGYLRVNPAQAPAVGIVTQTIQYHGTADLYDLNGATSVATLYSNATTTASHPAVTLRSVGSNGGQAAAFTYDLARSVVYTRQGNSAWAGQERDGLPPIRPDDLFYPNWIDFSKVAIPQADEQQRLLANLIMQMNLDKKPLPRFWYFPRGLKAVVVMTGDGHPGTATASRFDQYIADSLPGCSVDNWECVRSTAYIFPDNPGLSDDQANFYAAQGFEVALHVDTGCSDYTPASIATAFGTQLSTFAARYSSLSAPATQRLHCVVWSDWISQAKVEASRGIRLDTTYYYWPGSWVQNRPGFFTGSGIPMRFADVDGSLVDVYQAPTQMTDESGQTYPSTVDTLLRRAVGSEGYYGAFTANMHVDDVASNGSNVIISSAKARGIPVVSARQMLWWVDGRNNSAFRGLSWSSNALSFNISLGSHVTGIQAMLPISSAVGTLKSVKLNGSSVWYQSRTIKGIPYAFFSASSGAYVATYGPGKSDQTIIFNPLPDKIIGDPSFAVTATASSGLPVTFTVSGGVCSISGATVTLTGSGTCTVTAHQAGNGNYYPAPDVSQSFYIAKRNQTIAFNPLPDKNIGDLPFTVVATATSSLPVTVTVSAGTCNVTGNMITLVKVGSCIVTAHQAGNASYNAAPDVAQTFTIRWAKLFLALISAYSQ